MRIQIVIALDENYWHKSKEYGLFDSIMHNTSTDKDVFVKCLCIGFDVPINDEHFKHHRWDWERCEINELKSFRKGFPRNQKNRPFYICAEGGEFLDYFFFDPGDVIVHIDADMVMQRPFYSHEKELLISMRYGDVGGTYHSMPSFSLEKESKSLNPTEGFENIKKHIPNHWEKPVFCAGLIACTAQTYKDVIYSHYIPMVDVMTMLFDHHAAGQLIMNYVVYEHGNFVNLGHVFHHADWFIGADKKDLKDNQLCYKSGIVLFNHHKFNRKWGWNTEIAQ